MCRTDFQVRADGVKNSQQGCIDEDDTAAGMVDDEDN
jgi:hypothetical protein